MNNLKNKNICVTGGLGFIGSCLIRKLLNYKNLKIFNIDFDGYASSDDSFINLLSKNEENLSSYQYINIDIILTYC